MNHPSIREALPLVSAPASFSGALLALLLTAGCAGAIRWSQFHADAQSEGFLGVHTRSALFTKWEVQVGPVAFSSPVIGPDGTVYVGTTDGKVMAARSDGSGARLLFDAATLFQRPTIFSSPAVDAAGNVFVIVTRLVPDPDIGQAFRSAIVSVGADGTLRWSFPFDGVFVTTSPKVWGGGSNELIFVSSARIGDQFLAAFNLAGQQVYRQDLTCPSDVEGGGTGTVPNPKFPQNWDANGPFPLLENPFQPASYSDFQYWLDPTVAVADAVRGAPLPHPIVVLSTCAIQALELTPGPPVSLKRLWVREKYQVYSSPAVSRNGAVVTGSAAGHVTSYDLQTGRQLWDFDAGQPVLATPAFFLGGTDVYVASGTRFFVIDWSFGTVNHQVDLPGPTVSSAALTWDGAYLGSTAGMRAFSFDLGVASADGAGSSGRSSPAVANDGTVYAVTSRGTLRAYEPP